MPRTLAFIQARMSSSRFPGKVLEPLGGLPLIVYMARRAATARRLDGVVVVTSTDVSDDPLVTVLEASDVAMFRGDLHDVLNRYAQAAQAFGATEVVRLTGDCPLIDPAVIDAVIDLRRSCGADYASNIDPPSYPDGLDVECFTAMSLQRALTEAQKPSEREHVTLWMRGDASGLRQANLRAIADASALRLTVDYPDDLLAIRALIAHLPANGQFDWFDLLRVMQQAPELAALNLHQRNEGLAKSLAADIQEMP